MPQYIALLRGINVSGQKLIKMAKLRDVLTKAGFSNVRTYIQSGNILLQSDIRQNEIIEELIADVIRIEFTYDVPVFVMQLKELESAMETNPFQKEGNELSKKMYFTFLRDVPAIENIEKFNSMDFPGEKVQLMGNVVFSFIPKPQPKSKLNNNLIENKLKVSATTRNLNTVKILCDLSKNQGEINLPH